VVLLVEGGTVIGMKCRPGEQDKKSQEQKEDKLNVMGAWQLSRKEMEGGGGGKSIKYQQFSLNVYILKIFPNYSSSTNTHISRTQIVIVKISRLFSPLFAVFGFLEEILWQLYGIFGESRINV
jgi:hypothetical protein